MPRFRNLSASAISEKTSAVDLVTEADILAEKRITAALLQRFPSAHIVGEEAYDADRSVIPALRDAPLAFVIDPSTVRSTLRPAFQPSERFLP